MKRRTTVILFSLIAIYLLGSKTVYAQRTIELTFDSAIDIALKKSYQVRQLQLGIKRTRKWLEAERADLKSKLYLNLSTPDIESVSQNLWNSTSKEWEIVRQNTRQWQMNFSLRQPVILFGYPTNGYLSFNNKVYRYTQLNDSVTTDYYNRYFLKFEQPLFQPNTLKNNLEQAELNLEQQELQYLQNLVQILGRIANDYFDLYRLAYRSQILQNNVSNLEKTSEIANAIAQKDTSRSIEAIQVQVDLANAREELSQNTSDIRLQKSDMKQRLRLTPDDSLSLSPQPTVNKIPIDVDQAIQYGYTLRPNLRLRNIYRRKDEIDLDNTKGWNAFRVNLEMTYGLEKQDPLYQNLWQDQDNSYSISLNAYIPLWDWGQRKARLEARKIDIQRDDLYIEENKTSIKSAIQNAVANLREYQDRATNMRENMDMAKEITSISIEQYQDGKISLQDLLQTIDRQRKTEMNFLEAYLGYRRSLLTLMRNTYYDYEHKTALRDRFQDLMQ